MRRLSGRSAALLLLALATRAHAADLQVHAPDDCASAAVIGAQVEGLIGRPLAQVEHVGFAVEIAQRSAGDFMRSLRTTRDDGSAARTRQLRGASCAEVGDAAAVAIAMAITGASPAAEDAAAPANAGPQPHALQTAQPSALRHPSATSPPINAAAADALPRSPSSTPACPARRGETRYRSGR